MANPEIIRGLIHPEDINLLIQELDRAVRESDHWSMIWRNHDKEGNLKWLKGNGRCFKTASGTMVIDSIVSDISNLKNTQHELEESKKQYELAAKAAHLGFWDFDVAKNYLSWDTEMFNLFGVNPEDFTFKFTDWKNTVHPEDKEKAVREVTAALNNLVDFNTQFRIIRPDNQKIRHIRATAHVVTNEKGEAKRMFGLNWDVTFMVEAQEKLAESNRRYELASKATSDAIWDWDIRRKTLNWSQAYYEIYGHQKEDAKNQLKLWKDLIHPDDHSKVWDSLNNFIESKENIWEESYRLQKSDGSYAHVVDRGFLLRDTEGTPYRMVGAIQDRTPIFNFLEAIRSQNAQLKEIAWIQSHKLRGPLTKIMGLVDLAESSSFQEIEEKDFFDYVKESARQLDDAIHEIVKKSEGITIENIKNEKEY